MADVLVNVPLIEATAEMLVPLLVLVPVSLEWPIDVTAEMPAPSLAASSTVTPPVIAATATMRVPVVTAARGLSDAVWIDQSGNRQWNRLARPKLRVTIGGHYSHPDPLDADERTEGSEYYRGLDWTDEDEDFPALVIAATEATVQQSAQIGSPQVATARVTIAEQVELLYPLMPRRLPLLIDMGYADPVAPATVYYKRVFTGWVSTTDAQSWPYTDVLSGFGMLWQANLPAAQQLNLRNTKDWQAVQKALDSANVKGLDLAGEEFLVGVGHQITMQENSPPAAFVGELDRLFGYCTYDAPNGIVRRRIHPTYSKESSEMSPSYTVREGVNAGKVYPVLAISRAFDWSAVRNRVKVLGRIPDDPYRLRPAAGRRAISTWVPVHPQYVSEVVASDLIESQLLAEMTATRLMWLFNRPSDTISVTVPGTPTFLPTKVVNLIAPSLGINSGDPAAERLYVVESLEHSFSVGGWTTSLSLRLGAHGDQGDVESLLPVAGFTVAYDLGPDFLPVTCSGAESSSDPDSDGELIYYWSNDQNADVLSGAEGGDPPGETYVTVFEAAQWAAGPRVTLVVEDADRLLGITTRRLNPFAGGEAPP